MNMLNTNAHRRFRHLVAAAALGALLPLAAWAKDEPTPIALDASFKPAEQATKQADRDKPNKNNRAK